LPFLPVLPASAGLRCPTHDLDRIPEEEVARDLKNPADKIFSLDFVCRRFL